MEMIQAIDARKQEEVVLATHNCLEQAKRLFARDFDLIPINFDLKGRAAGMFRVKGKQRVIRYNPYIFAKYFEENLKLTVPHEVAHYLTDEIYGIGKLSSMGTGRVRPHGREWQAIMHKLGVDACRTCSFDMSGLPVRKQHYHLYRCACSEHQLGSRRHNKVSRQQANYYCRKCRGLLSKAE